MWRLAYPLRYLRLKNAEKSAIEWIATFGATVALAAPFIFIPGAIFFRNGGFLDKALILTSALTGFYVAALVAAATFAHPDLDKTITAGPIALISKDDDGVKIAQALTRREFVCMIFGYLAFLSMAISVLSSLAIGIAESGLMKIISATIFWYLRALAILGFSLMVSHLMVVTSLGIYYLMDRLYRRDRQIKSKKTGAEAA
jgi:hypothetical protein